VAIIKAAQKQGFPAEVVIVLSDRKDAPVLQKAEELGVKAIGIDPGPKRTFLIPEMEAKWVEALREHEVDYVLLAGFMRLLKKTFLDAFEGRILNIHPALLPSFKGLDAQRQAWEYGVKYSGATVHFVDDSLDGGPIILQEVVQVTDDDTAESLAARILQVEHCIYPKVIALLAEGRLQVQGRRVKILKETHER